MGLLERYCTATNRKNIVIKVSEAGKNFYNYYAQSKQVDAWHEMFKELDKIDKESIQSFTND